MIENTVNLEKKLIKYVKNIKVYFFVGFILFIVFTPISISLKQIGIGVLLIFTLIDMISKKRFIKIDIDKVLLLIFIIYLLINSAFFSMNPAESLDTMKNAIFDCFLVYFISTYLIENKLIKIDLILILIIIAVFIQGMDGLYQYIYKVDFIKGTNIWGNRLTASLDTPRVGNYVSLALPAFFLFYIRNKAKFFNLFYVFLYWCLILPPLFLLIFSRTRSGWIGFFIFIVLIVLILPKRVSLTIFPIFAIIMYVFKDTIYKRMNLKIILEDPRFNLWEIGIKLFKEKPFCGHGISTYRFAFNKYGFYPTKASRTIQHPHNIYVQFLSETGIIGFILFFVFIFYRFIELIKAAFILDKENKLLYLFNLAWIISYLATAFSAHSFFRVWWLGMFMLIYAITKPNYIFDEE